LIGSETRLASADGGATYEAPWLTAVGVGAGGAAAPGEGGAAHATARTVVASLPNFHRAGGTRFEHARFEEG
jgi:hypothetical protein